MGGAPCYAATGNLLRDGLNSYTWDVYGKMASISSGNSPSVCGTSGICLTYDALGHVVEKNSSGVYTEILYSPIGKTANMSGSSTVNYSYLPLPGGATMYSFLAGGTGRFYQHKDWLGSARLETGIVNRAEQYDRALAPFGEVYNNFDLTTQVNFTGDTQDISPALFDTPNRQLHPNQGRWLSPDPAGIAAVNMASPQTWNRYAYLGNAPLTEVDSQGLACYPVERNLTGNCDVWANLEGWQLGANWNEFYMMNSDMMIYGPKWIPFYLSQAGPTIYLSNMYATTLFIGGWYLGWGPIGDGVDAAVVFSGRLVWDGPVASAYHPPPPPPAVIRAVPAWWEKLSMQAGCVAGTDPELMGPAPSGNAPQDSSDSTPQTEGQQELYGPNKDRAVIYNTPSQVPSAVVGVFAHGANAGDCLQRIPK